MIIDLNRSIDLRWLLMSGVIFIISEGSGYQFGWFFSEKCPRGGHFKSKNLYCRFWGLQTGFLWALYYNITPIFGSCAWISYYLALIPPCIYETISIVKDLQCNFPKMGRRGGSKAVWNFSKNSSYLVALSCCKTFLHNVKILCFRQSEVDFINGRVVALAKK